MSCDCKEKYSVHKDSSSYYYLLIYLHRRKDWVSESCLLLCERFLFNSVGRS